jgi:hypothetical protein
MADRKYLPTFAELVDRLTITQLKAIFIPDHKKEYDAEIELIEHDLDLLLENRKLSARQVRAICVIATANRFIWENESIARAGGSQQDGLLKLTHAVNGVRNTAKNVLSQEGGDRLDYKIDCIACDLPEGKGNWNVFQ